RGVRSAGRPGVLAVPRVSRPKVRALLRAAASNGRALARSRDSLFLPDRRPDARAARRVLAPWHGGIAEMGSSRPRGARPAPARLDDQGLLPGADGDLPLRRPQVAVAHRLR